MLSLSSYSRQLSFRRYNNLSLHFPPKMPFRSKALPPDRGVPFPVIVEFVFYVLFSRHQIFCLVTLLYSIFCILYTAPVSSNPQHNYFHMTSAGLDERLPGFSPSYLLRTTLGRFRFSFARATVSRLTYPLRSTTTLLMLSYIPLFSPFLELSSNSASNPLQTRSGITLSTPFPPLSVPRHNMSGRSVQRSPPTSPASWLPDHHRRPCLIA